MDYLSFDLRLLMAIGLSVLWFTTSDGHWIICPLIYDFWLPLWVSSNFSIWTHIQWKIICLKCVACFLKFTKTDFLQTPINQSINQSIKHYQIIRNCGLGGSICIFYLFKFSCSRVVGLYTMFHVNMAQLFIALKIKGPGWLNELGSWIT